MFGIGLPEFIIIGLIIAAFHIPIYRAYRRNLQNNVPPKIWASVLLSILPSPVGGILYTAGIVPAVISFCVLVVIMIVADLFLKIPAESSRGTYILIMAVIAGIVAYKKGKALSVPQTAEASAPSNCPICGIEYDPQQYSTDSAEWICPQCHAKLPKA